MFFNSGLIMFGPSFNWWRPLGIFLEMEDAAVVDDEDVTDCVALFDAVVRS